ncbi:MAG: amidohydrolase, partial [Bacilli bacterium]
MIQHVLDALERSFDSLVTVRRYLHQHPELSFKEYKTAAYIADFYKGMDVDVRTNVGGNGVVVTMRTGKPGKTVALRADFDAL